MIYILIIHFHNKPFNEINESFSKFKYDSYLYTDWNQIDFSKYSHIFLSGSKADVYKNQLLLRKKQVDFLIKLNKPMILSCYTFHLFAYYTKNPIDSFSKIHRKNIVEERNFLPIPKKYFYNHLNYIPSLNNKWITLTNYSVNNITFVTEAIMKNKPIWGLQYHPESFEDTRIYLQNWVEYTHQNINEA